jgi:hypothetical protein
VVSPAVEPDYDWLRMAQHRYWGPDIPMGDELFNTIPASGLQKEAVLVFDWRRGVVELLNEGLTWKGNLLNT